MEKLLLQMRKKCSIIIVISSMQQPPVSAARRTSSLPGEGAEYAESPSKGGNIVSKIYMIEDDDNIRDMVLYALSSAGFEAEGCSCGEALWTMLDKAAPSLLLLDVMLPGEDGLVILKKLRQSAPYKSLPIILLTAKGTEYDRIKGLDLGADDYITKPFSVLEVISRVRAVLRRSIDMEDTGTDLKVGAVTLYQEKRQVMSHGEPVLLTFKEFELLYCLMRNAGIVLSRDKLLEQVWGFDYNGETRTIDMHIRSLRQKLGSGSVVIKTVRNVGYKAEDA